MKGTLITSVQPFEGELPRQRPSLLLVEPERIPPHLAFIEEHAYYSLSVKGVEAGVDASGKLDALSRKGKPFLLLGLDLRADPLLSERNFRAYEGYGPPLSSCIRPIVERLGVPDHVKVPTVHELLAWLDESSILQGPHLLFDKAGEGRSELRIPPYEETDVQAHLRTYHSGKKEV